MTSVSIIGGGNIAHSLAVAITQHQDVTVVTRRPDAWSTHVSFEQAGVRHLCLFAVRATCDIVTVNDADVVFVALPQFAVGGIVSDLAHILKHNATVVFVPAPAKMPEYAEALSAAGCQSVGIQRVPFISRTLEYGHLVRISDPRAAHKIFALDGATLQKLTPLCQKWFGGSVEYLSSYLSFAFSNSNPLLHPARLKVLLDGGDNGKYVQCPYFYADWTDASSELYLAADREMYSVFSKIAPEAARRDYESVLAHYDVTSSYALTRKIRSIESFKKILAPWKQYAEGWWEPDYESRYFTEDIPFGTKAIQSYARQVNVETPTIDMFIREISRARKTRKCLKADVNERKN